METYKVLEALKKRYVCREHPSDKRAIVVEDISLKELGTITEKYQCSGYYIEERKTGVITNFGFYK